MSLELISFWKNVVDGEVAQGKSGASGHQRANVVAEQLLWNEEEMLLRVALLNPT